MKIYSPIWEQYIQHLRYLRVLDLSTTDIPVDVKTFNKTIMGFPKLRKLDLSNISFPASVKPKEAEVPLTILFAPCV